MRIGFFKNLLSALIVLSITVIYIPDAQAAGCADNIIKKCQANGRSAGATDAVGSNDIFGGATLGSSEAGGASTRMKGAAKGCREMKSQCSKCTGEEKKKCEEGLEGSAGQMDAQSASMGDASQMMGALAGLAAAAMAMANKKKEEEKQEEQNNSALQPNGQIDCSKPDAYMFPDCDSLLSASCKNAMSDARCTAFANRYCGAQGISAAGVTGPGVPYGGAGQGVGSQFCGFVAAYGYCAPGGRDQCPSCLRLAKESSQVCQSNPAMCLAQNSPDVLATSKAMCPGDPVFADPSVAAVGNGQFVQPAPVPVVGGGAGLPVPVLPGAGGGVTAPGPVVTPNPGAGGGGIPVVNPNPGGGGVAGGGIPVPPPINNGGGNGIGIAGAGIRDQLPGVNASAGGGGVAAGTVIGIQSVGGGGGSAGVAGSARRDSASVGGGRAVANSGPAPDVQGQYGPSLFATSSAAIRNRCAAGKLLNCR